MQTKTNEPSWISYEWYNHIARREVYPMSQTVKNLPAMQETRVPSMSQEDPWRREWQSTPMFLPGESHGQKSLVGYSPWGHKE